MLAEQSSNTLFPHLDSGYSSQLSLCLTEFKVEEDRWVWIVVSNVGCLSVLLWLYRGFCHFHGCCSRERMTFTRSSSRLRRKYPSNVAYLLLFDIQIPVRVHQSRSVRYKLITE